MITQENITIPERLAAPKPKIFRTLRTVSMILAGIGGAIVAAPVALPAIVGTVATYLIAAGSVAGAVASLPVDFEALAKKEEQ